MSGPITVGFSFGPLGAVALAAYALREAVAMGQEYAEALEQIKEREAEIAASRRQQQENRLEQYSALFHEVERCERRLGRLKSICSALDAKTPGTFATASFQRPEPTDQNALIAYVSSVRQEIQRIEALLAQTSAELGEKLHGDLDPALNKPSQTDLDELLKAYTLQRSLQPGLDQAQSDELRHTVTRVLSRLELDASMVMPQDLEMLAREIMLAPSIERADELATELRLRVQRYREELSSAQQDAAEAKSLLEALPDNLHETLRASLERVASGTERLDPNIRKAVQEWLVVARKARERLEQEAAATVLEQSLRDLGFEVEEVENTLFVEGGMIHFQRQGWENYFVRMRLDPQEKTLNFNVVRPRGDESNAERKRLDLLAEDRWCSEFPRLMKTLEARGLMLNVTRQLGAGELPVQAVDPASLPQGQREEEHNRVGATPLHMKHS